MTESKFRTFSGLLQHHENKKKNPSMHLAKLPAPEQQVVHENKSK